MALPPVSVKEALGSMAMLSAEREPATPTEVATLELSAMTPFQTVEP